MLGQRNELRPSQANKQTIKSRVIELDVLFFKTLFFPFSIFTVRTGLVRVRVCILRSATSWLNASLCVSYQCSHLIFSLAYKCNQTATHSSLTTYLNLWSSVTFRYLYLIGTERLICALFHKLDHSPIWLPVISRGYVAPCKSSKSVFLYSLHFFFHHPLECLLVCYDLSILCLSAFFSFEFFFPSLQK